MLNFTLPFPLRHKIRADKKKHHLSECSRHAPRSYRITVGNCQLHEQLEMEKRSMKIHTTNVFLHLIPPNFTSGFSETCLPSPPPFLARSQKLRRATITFVMSIHLSDRLSASMEQLCSHWPDFHEFRYLRNFRKSVKTIQFWLKSARNNGYVT